MKKDLRGIIDKLVNSIAAPTMDKIIYEHEQNLIDQAIAQIRSLVPEEKIECKRYGVVCAKCDDKLHCWHFGFNEARNQTLKNFGN